MFNRRDLGLLLVSPLVLGGHAHAAPGGQAPASSVLRRVNPELRDVAAQSLKFEAAVPPLSDQTLAARRKNDAFARAPLPDVPQRRLQIPGPEGGPPLNIYIVNERAGAVRPAILHTHGGGFVLGTAAQAVRSLQEIAKALDCVIVTVDYRLAPETTFRGSVEDNYAGLSWLFDNAPQLGVDRGRIAVMGESAGGGHAALLAIAARDRGKIPLVFQCLIYPMLDDRTGSSQSVAPDVGRIGWNTVSNRYGWRSFLGREPGTGRRAVQGVPARVASVASLPPTFIGVGDLDLFVEEDIAYARRLIGACVPTELVVVPGAYHGFDGQEKTSVARRFSGVKLGALARAFDLAG